tara:strand:- start:154 stop:402 length:249 start_codon:yes stop_codon:yes gene_type:complete
MSKFYKPDFSLDPNSPFARDQNEKLVRRNYWLDMPDQTLILLLTQGIGANLTNSHKKAHLEDINRGNLVTQVCIQEVLPPEN